MIPWPIALAGLLAAFLLGCAMGRWLSSAPLITDEDLSFCGWCDGHPDARIDDCECLAPCGRPRCLFGHGFTDGLRIMLDEEAGHEG